MVSPVPQASVHEQLSSMLVTRLSVKSRDAQALAYVAIKYSSGFEERYDLVKPPQFHNFLVNVGMREKGLCWHFAYDLLAHLKVQDFKAFDYYIGGAHIDDYWQEHNSLVVTCKGCTFDQGVLLDPWRNSGSLFFSPVTKDATYLWTQRGGRR